MTWLIDNIVGAIWKFFADLVTKMIDAVFQWITELIINLFDIYTFFPTFDTYMTYIQCIAAALLLVLICWEALKQQSEIVESEKSVYKLAMKTISAATGIYFLPWSVFHILIPINNLFIQAIQSIGVTIRDDSFNSIKVIKGAIGVDNFTGLIVLIWLVMACGLVVLAVSGGIRYMELMLCILLAPFAAVSIIKGTETIQVWVKETIAVTFTQTIHVFLLQVLLSIIANTGQKNSMMMCILSIGTIAVMLKGPTVLRNFLYSSGTASTTSSFGKAIVMKTLMKGGK